MIDNDFVITLDGGVKLYGNNENNPLAVKWFKYFEELIEDQYGLEKNFCFLGFPEYARNGNHLCAEITKCVNQVNEFFKGEYKIDRTFNMAELFNHETLEINKSQ